LQTDLAKKKILVTGGAGFLGTHVVKKLVESGSDPSDIRVPRSKTSDLRLWENCTNAVSDIDIVIHLAGKGGGIGFNQRYPGSIVYDNVVMGAQLMEAARQAEVSKFVMIGTVCSYPKFLPVPFKEEDLWNGYPEETNAPYGLSKKILLVQGKAYREEYSFNAIHLLLVNMYGPRDDFGAERSHAIPALIKRMAEAKASGKKEIVLWGTGKPSREFLYVEDAAEGIYRATSSYDGSEPVNLGSGSEITIRDLATRISELVGYDGTITWDTSKPDGQPRRSLDTSRAQREFGFKASTSLSDGLRKTIEWYQSEVAKSPILHA
jgi:GDP-L-fucose synthase